MVKKLSGIPYGWWETGTEGVHWCLVENWKNKQWSYNDLHVLQNGDQLIITLAADGSVCFDGVVALDNDLLRKTYPVHGWDKYTEEEKAQRLEWGYKPTYDAQVIQGFYVHGVQPGVDPNDWFNWFMDGKGTYLAQVIRNEEAEKDGKREKVQDRTEADVGDSPRDPEQGGDAPGEG